MKVVIDIPKEGYKRIMDGKWEGNDLTSYIKDGTPLPKRMLSVDLIIETLCPKDEDYDYPCIAPSYLEEELERLLLDDAPTIIEADKVESEEDSDNLDSMLEDLWNATESEEEICSNNFIQLKQDVLNNKQLWRKLREIEDEDSD